MNPTWIRKRSLFVFTVVTVAACLVLLLSTVNPIAARYTVKSRKALSSAPPLPPSATASPQRSGSLHNSRVATLQLQPLRPRGKSVSDAGKLLASTLVGAFHAHERRSVAEATSAGNVRHGHNQPVVFHKGQAIKDAVSAFRAIVSDAFKGAEKNTTDPSVAAPTERKLRVNLVIARRDDDISWLKSALTALKHQHVQVTTYIYESGLSITPASKGHKIEPLPSAFSTAHTYLHHMASATPSKHDVTVFVPGAPDTLGLTADQMVATLMYQAMQYGMSVNVQNSDAVIGGGQTYDAQYYFTVRHCKQTLGQWFDTMCSPFVGTTFPQTHSISYYPNQAFAIRSELKLPVALLKAGITQLSVHKNKSHLDQYFHRSWFFMFASVRSSMGGEAWAKLPIDPLKLEQRSVDSITSHVTWHWEGCQAEQVQIANSKGSVDPLLTVKSRGGFATKQRYSCSRFENEWQALLRL